MNFNDILNKSDHFRYQLLSRMKSDCDYYLGNGGHHVKYLWADNEVEHIDYMKQLWNSFDENEKPEWLPYEELLAYEKEMCPKAILVEMDYKGYYERFALTPEEFEKEFPETYKHFGPIEESNSDTLKPLVHIWFSPVVVGDSQWDVFFTDMAEGLPESDVERGNFAYIDHNQMQSLSKYLKDTAVFHCRAVYQHDNFPFAEFEIKNQCMAARVNDLESHYSIHNFKCVEEGPADGAADFPNDKYFIFEFDVKTPRDSTVDITKILNHIDGGELLSSHYERSADKPSLDAQVQDAAEQVRSAADKGAEKKFSFEQDL